MTRSRHHPTDWGTYLSAFHQERPGITEEILAASTSAGNTPYEWLLELIPQEANLLDLACGSAPLLRAGWTGPWVGVDRSPAELDLARASGGQSVVVGAAHDLQFDDHSFAVVACSMALMLLDPLDECLAEVARVLAPGGIVAFLLPGGPGPLTDGDLWRWGRLLVALRRTRFEYPNDRPVRHLDVTVRRHGLAVVTDDRRRFAYSFSNPDAADRFVDSLYLPGVPATRTQAAQRVANAWVGCEIGIPLRRVFVRAAARAPRALRLPTASAVRRPQPGPGVSGALEQKTGLRNGAPRTPITTRTDRPVRTSSRRSRSRHRRRSGGRQGG